MTNAFWAEWIGNFFVTLLATFAGVSWAISADNKREREEWDRQENHSNGLKEKLIFSLLAEIKGIQDFYTSNSGKLFVRSPYSFETKIIESTSEEQIKHISSLKLLYGLYELREHCRGIHQTLDALIKPNINFDHQEEARWQSNYHQYKEKLKALTPGLQALLKTEYTGPETDEYKAISV